MTTMQTTEPATLTRDEADELADHESIIDQSQALFIEVGNSLMAIRDAKLYRATHPSFEQYLAERWPAISKRRGYQLIDAAAIAKSVPIQNERQARALKGVPPEQAAQVYQAASEATNGQPTAKAIQQALQPDPNLKDWIARGKASGLLITWLSPFYTVTDATGQRAQYGSLGSVCEVVQAAERAHLPTPPVGWLIWRDDGPMIVLRHTATGYSLRGSDAAALVVEANQTNRFLGVLVGAEWRVTVDPTSIGRTDLHAYTAIHQHYPTIAAHDIGRLALRAYHAMTFEDDMPDLPDDLFDALWLAGYDWNGGFFVRNGEALDPDVETEGELWHAAGGKPTPTADERRALVQAAQATLTTPIADAYAAGREAELTPEPSAQPSQNLISARRYQSKLCTGNYNLEQVKDRQQVRQLCADLLDCLATLDGLPTAFEKAVEAVLTQAADMLSNEDFTALAQRLDGVVMQ